MKKKERDQLLQRYTDLLNRLDDLNLIKENTTSLFGPDLQAQILSIITDTEKEIEHLKEHKKKKEYLFNFASGGWNTEMAYYEEEAIEQALLKYGHPDTQEHLKVDIKSFRVSTPSDYRSQMLSFY
jgi:hypothetical protein